MKKSIEERVANYFDAGRAISTIGHRFNLSKDEVRRILVDQGYLLVGRDAGEYVKRTNSRQHDTNDPRPVIEPKEINDWMRRWLPIPPPNGVSQ